jgi:hypothetical protein
MKSFIQIYGPNKYLSIRAGKFDSVPQKTGNSL